MTWEAKWHGNGWRAQKGAVVDGKLFDQEIACVNYCYLLNKEHERAENDDEIAAEYIRSYRLGRYS